MFTGIIEAVGEIDLIEDVNNDKIFLINTAVLDLADVKPGDSISVNGVCLSVTELHSRQISVDISAETLACTTFARFKVGEKVNLEKALKLDSRLNGHIVSGHVDGKGVVKERHTGSGSQRLLIDVPPPLTKYICRKGSICIDGVSLTVNELVGSMLTVNIIPYTQNNTIISGYRTGQQVNLEIDLLARYIGSLIQDKKINNKNM